MSNQKVIVQGPGFCTLLTITFIILKLLGKVDWSWWWVLSPVWIPLAILLGIGIVAFIIFLLFGRN